MANHWIETAVGGVEVREVHQATLPHGQWWTRARNGWGSLILLTTAENVERLRVELCEEAERRKRAVSAPDLAAPGITHAQIVDIAIALDDLLAAFLPVISGTPRERLLAAATEQARAIAVRRLGQPLTAEQTAAIDLLAEGHLDQWTARACSRRGAGA